MSHLYEPDADRQLDEGTEPPSPCSRCGALLAWDEACPVCEDEADAEAAAERWRREGWEGW
jgi:hypothetical protein